MCGTIPVLPHTPSWQRHFYLSLTYVHLNHFKKASHKICCAQTSKAIASHFFSTSSTTYLPNFLSQQQRKTFLSPQTQINYSNLNARDRITSDVPTYPFSHVLPPVGQIIGLVPMVNGVNGVH